MSSLAPAIQVDGVGKRFLGLQALSQISLAIAPGTIAGVIGPNGAGKTTLFNVITGVITPDTGTVRYAGKDVTKAPFHARARLGVVRTFQTPCIFESLSVLDNVLVGAFLRPGTHQAAQATAEWALRQIGVEEPWDQPGHELNVAARKRVEMARLLATGARVILLDEAMAGLTPAEIRQMCGLIRQLRQEQGMTFLIIEHLMSVIMTLCDSVAVLHFGQKIAEGSPQAVSRDPVVREVYLGLSGGEIEVATG